MAGAEQAKYRPYPVYKPSGVEWLGDIPEGWGITRIKFVSECLDGARIPLNASERGEMSGPYPYWGANKVVDHIDRFIFDEELILLGEDGAPFFDPHKDVAFKVTGKIWPNNHVHILRPNMDLIATSFVTYCLNVTEFHHYITGSTRDKLNQSDMNEIVLRFPPLLEQTKIAVFLDYETAKIDGLIAKQQRLIALLEEKRQAVISHAVTKGLDPTTPLRPSGIDWLGDVPAHWEVKNYRYATQIYRGKFGHRPRNDPSLYRNGTFPFIQTGDVARADKYIDEFKQTLNKKGAAVSELFPAGTLVMAIAANIGDTAILNFEAYAPDSVVGFKPNKGVSLEFLRYSLIAALPALEKTSTQSTQANLNIDRIGSVQGAFAPIDEQIAIASYLDLMAHKFLALTSKAQSAITLLKERRTALISAAVTGKIDLRDWQPPEGAMTQTQESATQDIPKQNIDQTEEAPA